MEPLNDGPVALIGGGQASFACAERLRALGHRGPITILGEEPFLPYQRPPLSKAWLSGETTAERLAFRPADYYARLRITLRLGTRVTAVRPGEVLVGSEVLPFARALIATGAEPRPLPGALTLRSLQDAETLRQAMAKARHLLVIGGGYVGLEVAASARKLGLEVTLIEAAPRILGRVACAETADFFRDLHLSQGVDLREGVGLAQLEPGRAFLTDGTEIPADLAVAGIGVTPRIALAEAAGITLTQGAILVDAQARTSMPGVFAAGDCTTFPQDGLTRLESVGHAIDQAEVAAAAMLGAAETYRAQPWFWSDQYATKLQIAGLWRPGLRIVARSDGLGRSHWAYDGSRLQAVDAIDAPKVFMVAKRLLAENRSPDPETVAEADLRELLKG